MRRTDDDRRRRSPTAPAQEAGERESRPGRRAFLPALLLALASASEAPRVEAYRLYDDGSRDFIATSSEAVRWAPEVWGPGAELEWQLEAAPEWAENPDAAERAFAAVREALAYWSGIPGADIRWTVAEATAASTGRWVRDDASRIFVSTAGGFAGAGVWFRRNASERWEISECDVGATAQGSEGLAVGTLAEDLGTCLGLGPSAGPPTTRRLRTERPAGDDSQARLDGFWSSPQVDRPLFGDADRDRRTGAALLRPREAWLSTVGSISGSLVAGGEPVPYAHVWAFRAGGALADPVGAFSNRSGGFVIEGLEPGRYLLWAHPVAPTRHRFVGLGGRTEVKDGLRLAPVPVTAGETTGDLVISLRTGRDDLVP